MRRDALLTALALVLAPALLLPGRLDAADARKLLQESEDRHRTRTQEYSGALSVTSKDGKVRRKAWKSARQGYAGDAKLLIRFVDPPEVRGVGFLSLPRPGKSPDQWLYLPSMKRERRIAPQDRDASFVGTDFNYEDMEELDHRKYEVSFRSSKEEEPVAGQDCWVVEARPAEAAGKSLYERKLIFLRKDLLLVVRVDLFRPGAKEPVKQLFLENVEQVDGHWVARKLRMADNVRGSSTVVVLESLAFDRPQKEDRFTLQNLVREGGD